MDSVLVSEPIGSLYGIVRVPAPYASNSPVSPYAPAPPQLLRFGSQSSSVMFPRAALIPPCETSQLPISYLCPSLLKLTWAATVCDRVGKSLVLQEGQGISFAPEKEREHAHAGGLESSLGESKGSAQSSSSSANDNGVVLETREVP